MRSRKRPLERRHGDALGAGRRLDPLAAPLGGEHQIEPAQDHRQRQPLAHVETGRRGEADQLRVRLADELDAEADQAVDEDEGADELARLIARLGLPEHQAEDAEQHDALEQGFVELARVARRAERRPGRSRFPRSGPPRHVGRRAPQFAVHEIGEAAEEQPERHAAGDIIVDPQPGRASPCAAR